MKLSVISYRGNGEAGHNQNEDREQLHVSGLNDGRYFELGAVKRDNIYRLKIVNQW